MKRTIAVISTMDTKGLEAEFLRNRIREFGHRAILIDAGAVGPPEGSPDITNREVASKAGYDLELLLEGSDRDQVMDAMGTGTGVYLADMLKEGSLGGVMGIGGNQGSAIASIAMRALPIGFPKYLVSTVASGNIRPFIGCKDIHVVFSVSDLLGGLNAVTTSILSNSIAALVGMVEAGRPLTVDEDDRVIGISALGNTQEAVSYATRLLKMKGFQVIPFHASGAGGSAMEELVEAGIIHAVLDLTLHELTEEVMKIGAYVPVNPGRLLAAGKMGVPQVASTGGMEYLCFGPRESIPESFRDRTTYMHNPFNANVKINGEEMKKVARVMADRLNQAQGKTSVFVPLKGWSVYGSKGGIFFDPDANRMFTEILQKTLQDQVGFQAVDYHINDREFVDLCVSTLLSYMD